MDAVFDLFCLQVQLVSECMPQGRLNFKLGSHGGPVMRSAHVMLWHDWQLYMYGYAAMGLLNCHCEHGDDSSPSSIH